MTLFDTWDSYFTDNPRDPLCAQAGYRLDSAYLEAHYGDFLRAREIAMLTADSSALAAFLRRGVHRHG